MASSAIIKCREKGRFTIDVGVKLDASQCEMTMLVCVYARMRASRMLVGRGGCKDIFSCSTASTTLLQPMRTSKECVIEYYLL